MRELTVPIDSQISFKLKLHKEGAETKKRAGQEKGRENTRPGRVT